MKSPRTWIVIVDAHAARFFERLAPGSSVVERPELALTAPPRAPERGRAPRVQESVGPARHRIEARTPPRVAHERAFLEKVAQQLGSYAEADAFDQIIISAPARAAGLLKPALPRAVNAKLKDVWIKDLVHEGAPDIERRLNDR
ncbi:MAG: host attachment protein [Proteobacteria bacterium]|nr:host attachment protein [Pseudomonadota bacterium]